MSISAYDSNADTDSEVLHYEYPVVPGTDEWLGLKTHKEMLEAVQVPEELLKQMSTEEVVTTVLENPLLCEMYAYNNFAGGYDALRKNLNCLAELDSRPDAISCLSSAMKDIEAAKARVRSTEESEELDCMSMDASVISQCIKDKYEAKNSEIDTSVDGVLATSTTVRTPKGSSVSVYSGLSWADHGVTASQATAQTNKIMQLYPYAEKIEEKSPVYNCHNYAWNTSNPKKYWMNNPAKYMSDGSYKKNASALSGYRVYYSAAKLVDRHSAVILSNRDDNIWVKSKWGMYPAFEHNVHTCPYDDTTLTFWKKS